MMIFSLGYLFLAVTRWLSRRRRKNMYLQAVRQVFRQSSIYITRTGITESSARTLITSPMLNGSSTFTENQLVIDDHMSMLAIDPKQILNLNSWTSYYRPQGMFKQDETRDDMMLVLEARRPDNVNTFLEHELDVAPADKVHILDHGAAVAWKASTPFGILMHCTLDEFVTLSMAFCDGILTMDEDLEVCSITTVQIEGKCSSLVDSALQPNSADRQRVPRNDDSGLSDNMSRLTPEKDQMTDLWSNESLASNSSIGRTSMLDLDNLELGNDDEGEDSNNESGAGESMCDDAELTSNTMQDSISKSWKIVRSSSIAKPPNVLIYTGKIDSVRKFEKVRKVIEHCLDIDCYVIYHLKHEDLVSTPWIENTILLVIATKKCYDDANEQFLKYFQTGGKILGLGSGFDTTLVGQKQISQEHWISSFTFKSWTNVSLISGFYAYNPREKTADNCRVTELAKDKQNNVLIVKCDQETKKAAGCAILSQVLFDRDAGDLGVTPEMFNTLKKFNTARFEILQQLLSTLGIECNAQSAPKFTSAVLVTKTQELKDGFMKSIQHRLSGGILKSTSQSFNFTTNISEPVTEQVLPVVTEATGSVLEKFNKKVYFDNLQSKVLGNTMLYVDVVPTTMTLLDSLLFSVPKDTGLIAVARQQTSGKGRGGNSWLSPVGCAMFTLHVRIPQDSNLGHAVSYIQHITSLAVVHSVCKLPGYEDIDLRLKWPNDIYYGKQMKLGGVIVKSTFMDGCIHASIGCGFNVGNSNPTICINDVIQLHNRQEGGDLTPCSVEQLIARTVTNIETLIEEFQTKGAEPFKKQYYEAWVHSDMKVTLQSDNNREVTVVGVDDFGYLLVQAETGERISVTDDGNSFDMMKNLISMKVR